MLLGEAKAAPLFAMTQKVGQRKNITNGKRIEIGARVFER